MKRAEQIIQVTDILWQWYSTHKRELPWRDLKVPNDTERAYQVLVSEIMLQQTQVERVKVVFKNFLEQFPTVADLAAADNVTVITAWRGMGYNSRALRLRDAARTIHQLDAFPREMKELQQIKGIGHYTAAAIRNFAFNLPTPCLDTNIRRIIHRVFVGPERPDGTYPKDDTYLLNIADALLQAALDPNPNPSSNPHDTRNWHACLMDYGSLVCTKRNPKWELCPLTQAGLMKAAYKVQLTGAKKRQEPGRTVGSTFIPNRIFRGKVVEELRDEPAGLPLSTIGQRICLDWSESEHTDWLQGIINSLTRDHLVEQQGSAYVLKR